MSFNRHPGLEPGSSFFFFKNLIPAFAGMTMMLCGIPASAQPQTAAPDYSNDSTWLCLPGRADTCSTPLPTTALSANGYGSNRPSTVAKDPPVDWRLNRQVRVPFQPFADAEVRKEKRRPVGRRSFFLRF